MRQFFIILVCHCEKVWWDPGYSALRTAVEAMLDVQARVAHVLGVSVASTFCSFVDHLNRDELIADAVEAPEITSLILSDGNELGLHVHAPTADLHTGFQDRCIAGDASLLASLGLPRPVTYAAGDFVTSPGFVAELERACFQVDCSAYTLEGPMDRFGVRIDYCRPDLKSYRASRHDLCGEGDSSIIEIPVSGALAEFSSTVYPHLPPIQERIQDRYAALVEGVDVFQVFWHPFDIVTLDGMDNAAVLACGVHEGEGRGHIEADLDILKTVERALIEFARQPDVEIAPARTAAEAWRETESSQQPERE
jgi:hypothetical protein